MKEIVKKNVSLQEINDLKVFALSLCAISRPNSARLPQTEIRISLIVGSHPHIVFMKEFVENSDKCGGARPPLLNIRDVREARGLRCVALDAPARREPGPSWKQLGPVGISPSRHWL